MSTHSIPRRLVPTRRVSTIERHATRWLATALTVLPAVVGAPVLAQPEPASAVLVIEGGTLIDGNGGAPLHDAVIVTRGDRIERVARKGSAPYPAGATVIDASGKFILPGLIDAHLHYSGFLAELLLNHGVTSAFDIAGRNIHQVVQRDAIARGRSVGPRLFVPVNSVLGPPHAGNVAYGSEGPRTALSTEQATQITRDAIGAGADYINIRRGLTFEAFKATVDVAHAAGLAVVAQPIGPTVYAREAVLAGADILEHAAGVSYSVARDPSHWKGWGTIELASLDVRPYAEMDDAKAAELIQLMVSRGTYLELDLVAEGRGLFRQRAEWELQDTRLLSQPELGYIPPGVRAKWLANYSEFDAWAAADREMLKKGFDNYKRFARMFVKAGGKVMAGDDTSYGGWAVAGAGIHHELELLVDAGLTPMQAIMAATRNPAAGYRQLDKVGTVEAGKFADLLIVDADPLADIRNIHRISAVVKGGKPRDLSYHREFVDPFDGEDLEAPEWYRSLKHLSEVEGIRTLAGLTDPTSAFGQPCPGIESLSPLATPEGSPPFMLTIKGINFTTSSIVRWGPRAVPVKWISETELQATIDPSMTARAGLFPIEVSNPGPSLSQPKWGSTSNRARFIVGLAP